MKTLTPLLVAALVVAMSGPVFAWDNDFMRINEENNRQADEDNYRNRMLAIQEDLLHLEQQKKLDRDIRRMNRQDW